MTFVRIWRYAVDQPRREAFERAYGPDGDWARLFARQDGFVGTELLAGSAASDAVLTYATLDRWRDETDWRQFLKAHGEAYKALDLECEKLTVEEAEVGDFVTA